LAYLRDIGVPTDGGYSVTYELWVYNLEDGTSQQVMIDTRALGLAWRPGTHVLAYGAAYDDGYFTTRGEIDATKAKGIWAVDIDSGENMELVAPQNGCSLRAPQWSPDGRFVSFEEIWGYEGSGYFAFYDLEVPGYISFNEAFGLYDWSPDSMTIVHDDMTYTATGTERIYLRPRTGGESQQLSPDYELGYAFWPRFDPTGQQVAYLANLGQPDSMTYTLFVQPVSGGEPVSLGEFENALYLSWLPDGSGLIMSVGPYETRQVVEVMLADKSVRVLADGEAPALVP
jgi:Tol biopolymer transport system component